MLIASTIALVLAAQQPDTRAFMELQWDEAMPGVEFAQAYGVREGDGPHAFFARVSPGTVIPHHWHTSGYSAVMISGEMVNVHDRDTRSQARTGDIFHFGSKRVHAHKCVSEEPCVFYTHWDGAFDFEPVEVEGDASL